MKNKINLPLYFENMRELELEKIEAIERLDNVSISSKHKSTAFSADYYIPASVWDLQVIIDKK